MTWSTKIIPAKPLLFFTYKKIFEIYDTKIFIYLFFSLIQLNTLITQNFSQSISTSKIYPGKL